MLLPSQCLSHPPQAVIVLYFFKQQINFAFSRTSCKRKYKICVPLYKASFIQHNAFEIHTCYVDQSVVYFFLLLLFPSICIPPNFNSFFCLKILGYFQFLVVINKAFLNVIVSILCRLNYREEISKSRIAGTIGQACGLNFKYRKKEGKL